MQTELEKIIQPGLEMAQTAKEAVDFCYEQLLAGADAEVFYGVMSDICEAAEAIHAYIAPYLKFIRPNELSALCNDITDSIQRFIQVDYHTMPYPVFTFENEIKAVVYGLYEALEFAFVILPNKEKLKEFYQERDGYCLRARELNVTEELKKLDGNEYEITMVIMTFNLLDYFKQCFESLLKFTDFEKHKVQLVVFDHGSSDDTLEYLKQYEHLKFLRIYHLKENIKNELTFVTKNTTWYDTKYTMIIANDTIATKNYLENLLACIKSDDRIAWICPSMSNTSNNQGIPVNYETIEQMHEFAEGHNVSDPAKWEDLSRLIPVFSMYNNVCRKAINHEDPGYYEFYYGDDDMSRSFVRSGFRIIVCKDTYIHHYPSLTVNTGNDIGDRMYAMRKHFYEKFHYDAWNMQYVYLYFNMYKYLKENCRQKVLFIEPCMGAAVQHLRTLMHRAGIPMPSVEISSVSLESKFKLDMEGYSDQASIVRDYTDLCSIYAEDTFDAVFIPELLENINLTNYADLFEPVKEVLKPGASVVCGFKNIFSLEHVNNVFTFRDTNESQDFRDVEVKSLRFLKTEQIVKLAEKMHYSSVKFTRIMENADTLEQRYQYSLIKDLQRIMMVDNQDRMNEISHYIAEITK